VLQLPIHLVEKSFEQYPENKMTKEQFSATLTMHRKETAFGKKLAENNSIVMDGRKVKATEKEFRETNERICEKLFEGKDFFTLKDFINYRDSLQEALWHFEFH
jgi:hypothetical protein